MEQNSTKKSGEGCINVFLQRIKVVLAVVKANLGQNTYDKRALFSL